MTTDQLEKYGGSLIQHGPANDRVYLMKLDQADLPAILNHLDGLANRHNYSKIFVKVPASAEPQFLKAGYTTEAKVPGLYQAREDGLFMARYPHPDRLIDHAADQVTQVLATAMQKAGEKPDFSLPTGAECRLATTQDLPQMAELYARVFASYPFPIDQADYLRQTMAENILYGGVWTADKLLALASAEMDRDNGNAEMTDFATDPEARGQGLANALLQLLERKMPDYGIQTCYTIARATSFGMNITFAKNGYHFGGTLIKNTQISGGLESMNVWYKSVAGH